jgi:hypothetical protein
MDRSRKRQPDDMISDDRCCKLSVEEIVPALIWSEDKMSLRALVPLALTHLPSEGRWHG